VISLPELWRAWNDFFHASESVATLCVFRFLFGLLLAVTAGCMLPYANEYFGPLGILGAKGFARSYPLPRLSLFYLFPESARTGPAIVISLLVASVALALGLFAPISGPMAWLCLVSLHHRNPAIFNAGDSVQRIILLLLCFAPSGAALSLDCWLRGDSPLLSLRERQYDPWPLRLIQIQISIVYLRSVYWKLRGTTWRDGTAVAYVLQVMNFQRFAGPRLLLLPAVSRTLTWSTLFAEAFIGIGVWIREFRYPAIMAGWLLHIGFEFFLNVHLFGMTMCVALVSFIPPEHITRMLLAS